MGSAFFVVAEMVFLRLLFTLLTHKVSYFCIIARCKAPCQSHTNDINKIYIPFFENIYCAFRVFYGIIS